MAMKSARPVLALVAAYAVALQAILLAAGSPVAGAGAAICSPLHTGGPPTAPAQHGPDCLAACLACCCGAAALPPPGTAVIDLAGPAPAVPAAFEAVPALRLAATGAHRSRAPPLG